MSPVGHALHAALQRTKAKIGTRSASTACPTATRSHIDPFLAFLDSTVLDRNLDLAAITRLEVAIDGRPLLLSLRIGEFDLKMRFWVVGAICVGGTRVLSLLKTRDESAVQR
jgi:hypothetical protein